MVKREFFIFLIVGLLTVAVDFIAYRGFIWSELAGIHMAKGLSFGVGTMFAYLANRFWTFSDKAHASGALVRFIILYAVTLGLNVFVNSSILTILDHTPAAFYVAFVIATATSACLNFLGMKFFVFRSPAGLKFE